MRTPRRAARLAILDPDGAVFMFRYDDVEAGIHWATPGGGLDPGESPRAGAVRELHEETGWTDIVAGELLCTWEHDFTRQGVPVRQHEHIYLAAGPRREPTAEAVARHPEDRILGWKWWSPAEAAEPYEPLWPPPLPRLLAAPRGAPVDLGYLPVAPSHRA
ncbi:NUDIX hydrolase [Streptomyces sp. WAC 06738]|uniref:NUDIX hydrolase n=1 Tax=Streptomyces sp. WAC 06738 TaxID=2203210 RepID=UPI000F702879|nr:NUDIX domain-containing protein [Streptomyces sp. WAC 06738]AZM49399.1 NUDIX hydrolase [Streptomyces sp. WAC 06738]